MKFDFADIRSASILFSARVKPYTMASTKGNLISLIAAICLFLIILFMLPTKVGAASLDLCNGRGFRNASDGLCSCITGFHGEGCEYSKFVIIGFLSRLALNAQVTLQNIALSGNHGFHHRSRTTSEICRWCLVQIWYVHICRHLLLAITFLNRIIQLVLLLSQGSCDPFQGHCLCRPGFEGSACERSKSI